MQGCSDNTALGATAAATAVVDQPESLACAAGTATCGTWAHVADGIRRALPIILGYAPVAFAYGVLARKAGLPVEATALMSLLVYAGSAQLIAVGLFGAGAPAASIILTTFVVNLRHLLMSAAMAPRLGRWSTLCRALFAGQMTDETFAVHVTTIRNQPADPAPASVFALNVTAQSAWVGGSIIGATCSDFVADVRPLGMDYALAAMFIALLLPHCKVRLYLLVAATAGLLSVCFALAGAGRWNVIMATLVAATLGCWLETRRVRREGGAA